jgi:tRNA pseudouridine38-40 synthase
MQHDLSHANSITRNLLITLSYDGSNYHGWQVQKNAISVQSVFQDSLEKVIGEKTDIKGCSRTDKGVHANMYTVSFKTSSRIKCDNIIYALNRLLPHDIAVTHCAEVSDDFHARYSCIGKEYVYKIWNHRIRNPFLNNRALHYWYPLDISALNDAAKFYIGSHDFTSFATLDKRETKNMIRTVVNFDVCQNDAVIEMKVRADGFLYNMVRIMVGTLLKVAQGKIKKEDIPYIIESKSRKNAGPTAPSHGLYLNRVFYRDF